MKSPVLQFDGIGYATPCASAFANAGQQADGTAAENRENGGFGDEIVVLVLEDNRNVQLGLGIMAAGIHGAHHLHFVRFSLGKGRVGTLAAATASEYNAWATASKFVFREGPLGSSVPPRP